MSDVTQNVLPVFLLILVGWGLVKSGVLSADIGEGMSQFVFKLAVPVLLFHSITSANFSGANPYRLWLAYFFGVGVAWTFGHMAATFLFGRDGRIGVLAGLSAAFANTAFIGLPLVDHIVGPEGIVAVSILIAVHLPLMMVIGTVLMEQAERKMGGHPQGLKHIFLQIGRNLITNPLVLGLEAGILMHVLNLSLPRPLETVSAEIADMAGPSALISLGMTLTRYGIRGNIRIAAFTSLLKLVLMPLAVLLACHVLGLNHQWTLAMVLTSAVPTGVNAWLIANRFGVGHALAASTITLTTGLGVFSVSIWAWILEYLS